MKALTGVQPKIAHILVVCLCLIFMSGITFAWYFANNRRVVPSEPKPAPESGITHVATVYGDEDVILGETRSVYATDGRIYVSDTSNHRIVVLDYSGNFLFTFGDETQGSWSGMRYPYSLTVVKDKIYVADAGLMKVAVFDLEGNFLSYFGERALVKPINVVFSDQYFYFTDVSRQQVVILDEDGNEIHSFGHYGKGEEPAQFNFPNGLVVDASGRIYVADTNNSRIQIFNHQGEFLTTWKSSSSQSSLFVSPMNVALDQNNHLYVADPMANRILVLNQAGEIFRVIQDVDSGESVDRFMLPSGIWIDTNQRLYVSDTGNRRIVIYQLK